MGKIEEFYNELSLTTSSSMRLTVRVDENRKTKYYYDRGFRALDDTTGVLGTKNHNGEPRFLEDILLEHPDAAVSIREWGKYAEYKDSVETIIAMYQR